MSDDYSFVVAFVVYLFNMDIYLYISMYIQAEYRRFGVFNFYYFIIFVRLRVPLLTFGPPGRFFSRGDARRGDVTRFPFSGSDSSPCQDLSAT